MSQQQDLRDEVGIWSINLYIDTATTVWLYHEFLLTLAWERQCIWRRRFSAVTAVFYITRYLTLLKQALKIAQYVSWAGPLGSGLFACNILLRVDAVLTAALYANISVFSALRMYAISERNTRLAALVLGLGMVHVCTNAYTNNLGQFVPLPPPFISGCVQVVVPGMHPSAVLRENQPFTTTYRAAAYIGTASTIFSELVLQIYTWRKTLRIRHKMRSRNMNNSLFSLLLRDGAISYLLLTFWSILTRVVTRVNVSGMALPGVSVLLCRFILSLRQVRVEKHSSLAAARISRIVDNAGAQLHNALETVPMSESENPTEIGIVWITDDTVMADQHPDDEKMAHSDSDTLTDV